MLRRKLLFVIAVITCSNALSQNSENVYIFSYFKNNGQDGLHLAYSEDGYHFTALNRDSSFLKPTAGKDKLMRDPCIIQGLNGQFHMVWTVSWNEKGIGFASSYNLVDWSEQKYIPVMEHEDSARNCWAPEITYDPRTKEYMLYWATTIAGKYPADSTVERGYNHRMYYVTTKDFKTFSKSKILYDQGFNVIDATIVRDGKKFVMFLKDETPKPVPQKNIRMARSGQLTSGYSKPSSPITGNYWAEGPTAIKIKDNWIVYFDKYRDHKYGAISSPDLKSWNDISDKVTFPPGTRHGTILKISREVFHRWLDKYK
ncbi:MAG TPA: glycoside hydrolase family 43 protein [Chitinophagaceae bacterium]|nr:glycoside hydrolase family 43 protein [Chitinophagaceae bacterium]